MVAQANSRFGERRHGERRVVDDARFPRPPVLRPALPVKLSLADRWSVALSNWRLMAAVFLAVAALGVAVAFLSVKQQYEARVRLVAPQSVSEGDGPVASARPQIAALQSDALAKNVIGQLGARRIFPELDARGERGRVAAVTAFRRALSVRAAPAGDAIDLAFRAHDPRIAALVVDKLVSAYAVYERDANAFADDAPLAAQRRALEARMALAGDAMRAFLKAHRLGDYQSDLAAATALANALAHDVAVGKAELAEIDARLQSATDAGESARLNNDLAARAKKVTALQQEMTAASARANRLRALGPEFERLRFAQETVAAAAGRLGARDEDARGVESVRASGVLAFRAAGEPAVLRVDRLRLSLTILAALVIAALAGLGAGLARSFGGGILPTPSAAENYLDLPVLALTPRVAR